MILILMILSSSILADNISYPWTMPANDTVTSVKIKGNFNAVKNVVNGNITDGNIKSSAAISQSKIDSTSGWIFNHTRKHFNPGDTIEIRADAGIHNYINDVTANNANFLVKTDSTVIKMKINPDTIAFYDTIEVQLADSASFPTFLMLNNDFTNDAGNGAGISWKSGVFGNDNYAAQIIGEGASGPPHLGILRFMLGVSSGSPASDTAILLNRQSAGVMNGQFHLNNSIFHGDITGTSTSDRTDTTVHFTSSDNFIYDSLEVRNPDSSSISSVIKMRNTFTGHAGNSGQSISWFNEGGFSGGDDPYAQIIGVFKPQAPDEGHLYFVTGNESSLDTAMAIDKNRRVGIGTESPSDLLEVEGATPEITIDASSGNPGVNFSSGGEIKWTIKYNATDNKLAIADSASNEVINIWKNAGITIGETVSSSADGAIEIEPNAGGTDNGWISMNEISDPGNAGLNAVRIFAKDNGAGKTQLCASFNTGATQCFATEP